MRVEAVHFTSTQPPLNWLSRRSRRSRESRESRKSRLIQKIQSGSKVEAIRTSSTFVICAITAVQPSFLLNQWKLGQTPQNFFESERTRALLAQFSPPHGGVGRGPQCLYTLYVPIFHYLWVDRVCRNGEMFGQPFITGDNSLYPIKKVQSFIHHF